jgi:integrase
MWIATHDVHSLRVSGVSFLLDSGVPLAVVAAIAGHHTVQMTLHYYRFEERELRLRLSEAYAKLGAEKNLGMLEEKILEFNDYENEPELRK